MKKVTLFFALLFIAITFQVQAQPTDTDGNGYYNISTLNHLRWVSENDSCWSWKFELDNDINAGDTKNWNFGDHDNDTATADSAMGWIPIGNATNPFIGIFDGKGYAIDSLYLNRPKQDYLGLFGRTKNGQIHNINISNCSITGSGYVGGLVGVNQSEMDNCHTSGNILGMSSIGGVAGQNSTTITNCYSTGKVKGRFLDIGGLAGVNSGEIKDSYSNCQIMGSCSGGGLVGRNTATIMMSYATGNVTGSQELGGLVGENKDGAISHCYATGNISCNTNNNAGGLVGYNYARITTSYATGNVTGVGDNTGGLVGNKTQGPIIDCYARGSVTGGGDNVGGLTGNNFFSNIINSYATGNVTGNYNVGGLIGDKNSYSAITNSFWDIETSGQSTSAGEAAGAVEGKTTAEMKTKSTFTDAEWDFETTWNIDPDINDGYPYLQEETVAVNETLLPTTNLTCAPNPFTEATKIGYSVNNAGFVNITVYDIFGNEVATLINNYQATGTYQVIFNSTEIASGVYFVSINTNETMETQKIILER